MQVIVNGETHDLAADTTVAGLLGELKLEPTQVAVERNREIVPRARYEQTELADGDRVEIVTFVGGG